MQYDADGACSKGYIQDQKKKNDGDVFGKNPFTLS
jgi:hypothetical protein